MKMEQCTETSAYKIQTPGITQKKAYNIQKPAKVWNQDCNIHGCSQIFLNRCSYISHRKFSSYATCTQSANMEFHESDRLDNPIKFVCPLYGHPSMDAQASQTRFILSAEPKTV